MLQNKEGKRKGSRMKSAKLQMEKNGLLFADLQMLIQERSSRFLIRAYFKSVSLMGRAGWQLGSSRLGGVLEG